MGNEMRVASMVNGYAEGAGDELIEFVSGNIGVTVFPLGFRDCVKQCDEGVPEKTVFRFLNPQNGLEEIDEIGSFLSFLPRRKTNILKATLTIPFFKQKKLVPFAETGGGDYVCFDYSVSGFEDKDPPIVLWLHENENGKEISDLAKNFNMFMEKLEFYNDEK